MYTRISSVKEHVRDVIDGLLKDREDEIKYSTISKTKKSYMGVGSIYIGIRKIANDKVVKSSDFTIFISETKDDLTTIISNTRGSVLYYNVVSITEIPVESRTKEIERLMSEATYPFLDEIVNSTMNIVLSTHRPRRPRYRSAE